MASPDAVRFTIQDDGPGWANYVLTVGSQAFVMDSVSYCTDALGDLLRAALLLATGGHETSCYFDREPYQWQLALQCDINPERLFLRVLELPELQVAFRAECETRDFTLAVERAAIELLDGKGEDGYRAWWNMPFPGAALRALKAAHGYVR